MAQQLGNHPIVMARAIAGLAYIAFLQSSHSASAMLFSYALSCLAAFPNALMPIDWAEYEQLQQHIRSARGEAIWNSSWQEGQNLDQKQALLLLESMLLDIE